MTKLTERIVDTTRVTMDEVVHHSRMGDAIHKWSGDKTPGATEVVLTDTTLVYNLSAGNQVLITQVDFDVITKSDDCHFDLISCSAVNGGGTATALAGHTHVFTAAGKAGTESKERPYTPPIRVRYSDGARSITIRVDANDANCEISCGWHGWVED